MSDEDEVGLGRSSYNNNYNDYRNGIINNVNNIIFGRSCNNFS